MRVKYAIGQHGAKRREQRRLSRAHGERVTGRTHESEHTIGFAPLNESSNAKRGKSKASESWRKRRGRIKRSKVFTDLILEQGADQPLTNQALIPIPTAILNAI